MAHDHAADHDHVKNALKGHNGKSAQQIEARLRAFVDASLANIKATAPADLPAVIADFEASKEDAIQAVLNGV